MANVKPGVQERILLHLLDYSDFKDSIEVPFALSQMGIANAVAMVAANGGKPARVYELGGPNVYSFRELMEITLAEIGRKRLLVPVPFPIAAAQAAIAELAFTVPKALNLGPVAPITRDQVKLLRKDNMRSGEHPGLDDLGIQATALELIVPTYLQRYRRGVWHN